MSRPKRTLVLSLVRNRAGGAARKWFVGQGETIRIGRSRENDLVLEHEKISRNHAVICDDGEFWTCGSFGQNGTYVDGSPITSVDIYDGLVLQFAKAGPQLQCSFVEEAAGDTESTQPVTVWIEDLARGDDVAAERLWERYFSEIVGLARSRLGPRFRRAADEEDVALSVFDSLCAGVAAGRFPDLSSRDGLWRLLATMTVRKSARQVRHETREKRGGGAVRGESVLLDDGEQQRSPAGFDELVASDLTPDLALEMAEQAEELLQQLPDESLRSVALFRLEGFSNAEIAEELGCDPRTVRRRVENIRTIWADQL